MKNLIKLSKLHYDILALVNEAGTNGITTTEIIRWGVNVKMSNVADRRARELRENGYFTERTINPEEMAKRGLKTEVSIYHINENGRVWLQRLSDMEQYKPQNNA